MDSSPNIQTRRALKEIPRKSEFMDLLESCMLNETDKQIMCMKYIESKDWNYIADTLGYCESAIRRRHSKILSKIRKII